MTKLPESTLIAAQTTSPTIKHLPQSFHDRSYFVTLFGYEWALSRFEDDQQSDGYIRPGIIDEARTENDIRLFTDRSIYKLIFETYIKRQPLDITYLHDFLHDVLSIERIHDQEEFRKIAKAEEEGYTIFNFTTTKTFDLEFGDVIDQSESVEQVSKADYWATTRDYARNAIMLLPLAVALSKEVQEIMVRK